MRSDQRSIFKCATKHQNQQTLSNRDSCICTDYVYKQRQLRSLDTDLNLPHLPLNNSHLESDTVMAKPEVLNYTGILRF
jgi:hypothetical protein